MRLLNLHSKGTCASGWREEESTNSIRTQTKTILLWRCIVLVKRNLVPLKGINIPSDNLISQGDVHSPSANKQQCCGTKSKEDVHSRVFKKTDEKKKKRSVQFKEVERANEKNELCNEVHTHSLISEQGYEIENARVFFSPRGAVK